MKIYHYLLLNRENTMNENEFVIIINTEKEYNEAMILLEKEKYVFAWNKLEPTSKLIESIIWNEILSAETPLYLWIKVNHNIITTAFGWNLKSFIGIRKFSFSRFKSSYKKLLREWISF